MADGSLQKDYKTMIIHTQSYTKEENLILSKELNDKFNFNTKVIPHKQKYWVIKFHPNDSLQLYKLITDLILPSMVYKIPKI